MNKLFALSQILIIPILLFLYVSLYAPTTVYATQVPEFPVCSNPQGEVKVSYESGTHGVPGNSSEYQGEDIVYSLDNSNYLQCLCADTGEGIQTDWWNVSGLSVAEI